MADIPVTSTTLLRDIAQDMRNARWTEFVSRYRPMMEAYMRERFPSVEADDVIQETLIAVCEILPSYRYQPDEKGYFHNYLTGVLHNKVLRQLYSIQRQEKIAESVKDEVAADQMPSSGLPRFSGLDGRAALSNPLDDEQTWRETLVEIALRQLMNDESIQSRTRQIFLRVAVNGEKPEAVAAAFGIKRNAVDQIKRRMISQLQKIVSALEKAGNI